MHTSRTRSARIRDVGGILALLDLPGEGYAPSSTAGLAPLLERLLEEQALRGPVMERRFGGPDGELDAVALTAFTDLERARAWIAKPPAHFVDHVLECERSGNQVLLRPDRVATCNASGELALVFVAFRIRDADQATMHARIMSMMDTFRVFHAGYYCPIAMHPDAPSSSGMETLHRLGFRQVGSFWTFELGDLEVTPFSMFASLTRRPAPRFGFSAAEKEHLHAALLGATDAEIATELNVSLETVRKRWRSVFERVAAQADLRILPQVDVDEARRGPEKRGVLLAYLDTHLEELRPYRREGG